MTRERALQLMEQNIQNKNLRKHCLAMEAVLRRLAGHLGEDEDLWGLTGLLHDVDYEITEGNPETHAVVGAEMLRKLNVDGRIVSAVLGHNDKAPRQTALEKAVYASDPLTGLIVASALIHPDKRLAAINAQFVLNRFGEKLFAKGANREAIKTCAELGLSLEEFIAIALEAMTSISAELGL